MNILLIEDEEALSEVAKLQLCNLGNTVHSVSNLADADRFIQDPDWRIDLVIVDHRLPDGRGIDFIIQRKQGGFAPPCVVVSGCLTATDVQALDQANVPYMRKPVVYSNVVRRFHRRPGHTRPPIPVEQLQSNEPPSAAEPRGFMGSLRSLLNKHRTPNVFPPPPSDRRE